LADLVLDDSAVVTLPQPIIAAPCGTAASSSATRAATTLEEFLLDIARTLYPQYGFATMPAEKFGQTPPFAANDNG
jgi:hypothetical protein